MLGTCTLVYFCSQLIRALRTLTEIESECLLSIDQITLTNQLIIDQSHIIYSESTIYKSSLIYIVTKLYLLKLHLITEINDYIICILHDFSAVDLINYELSITQRKVQKTVKTFIYIYYHCLLSLHTYYDITLHI